MHNVKELPAWERLFKTIVWEQIGELQEKRILDFGSGQGITANHFARDNEVTAIEPCGDMLTHKWMDYDYTQIIGDVNALTEIKDSTYDFIVCHNVLEYIEDKESVVKELSRVLKPGGTLSIVKHNRAGRVMQMTVLLDDVVKANELLDGKDSTASQFGTIRYYCDNDIQNWSHELTISEVYGIRTFWDLQQNQEKHTDDDWQSQMKQIEMRVSQIEEYRSIAFFHHLLIIKR